VGRAGAGVFSDILNVRESYALGFHATVFKSEVFAFLACSEYCISEGIVNKAISICSDSGPEVVGVQEYKRASASALLRFALASSRFTPRFVHSYEHFYFLHCLILSVCLFFRLSIFYLCGAHYARFVAHVRRSYLAHF
jgi:hypothetical protein